MANLFILFIKTEVYVYMCELKKNLIIPVTITGYTSDGMGVAKAGGKVIFVKNAISGETCDIRILKVSKNIAYAKIESILEESSHRQKPVCNVFGKCGGCALLHMDYQEELNYKRGVVQDALLRIGGCKFNIGAVNESPQREYYRNKVIYNIQKDAKSGETVFGFFRAGTHDVIPASGCVIGFSEAEDICRSLLKWMEDYGVPAYDMESRTGCIRHVYVRKAHNSGNIQVGIVSKTGKLPHMEKAISYITNVCPDVKSIVLNINDSSGNTVLAGEFITIYGTPYIEDTLCGLTFKLSLRSFYQINSPQAENLYDKAVEFCGLSGKETVLDLYCGTGTITLCLARKAKKAIGAEIVPEAIYDAKENAARNGIDNTEFFCADASEIAEKLAREGLSPDVITVDPPRKGLSRSVIDSIVEMSPQKVVYVSCDPGTLARDVKVFSELGYMVTNAECFDMFPKCAHVETIVLLQRETL